MLEDQNEWRLRPKITCKMTTIKDIQNLMEEQNITSYFSLSQGDFGDYSPKVPAIPKL